MGFHGPPIHLGLLQLQSDVGTMGDWNFEVDERSVKPLQSVTADNVLGYSASTDVSRQNDGTFRELFPVSRGSVQVTPRATRGTLQP